ncbi:N-formylglutamate deformylase [Roseibium marinum]|uniref:Formiminoglutamase n=1 Tax=Roseibium marinum TaxID=281252 RepID=A0A2S3UN25_9HYPH|nr:N-formylglutamate deformylase [Roseibium marinum]POF29112.1 formiminoglutamase [Roseibium marinum]
MEPVSVSRGDSCLILSLPHTGTWLPPEVYSSLNERGRTLADTDWRIDRLYADLVPGVTVVRANFHRYLIDANRDPSGRSLYPGQNTTTLCPVTDFDGFPIYLEDKEPDPLDIQGRLSNFHEPYHAAIEAELARVKGNHGVAVLYDCHSIRSEIPFLFQGVLPDFNIGTNGGVTCAPEMEVSTAEICSLAKDYTMVLNGRFKGGWTTRHYGRPQEGVHAIQMELTQSAYLDAENAPFAYSQAKAEMLRPHLESVLQALIARAKGAAPRKEA